MCKIVPVASLCTCIVRDDKTGNTHTTVARAWQLQPNAWMLGWKLKLSNVITLRFDPATKNAALTSDTHDVRLLSNVGSYIRAYWSFHAWTTHSLEHPAWPGYNGLQHRYIHALDCNCCSCTMPCSRRCLHDVPFQLPSQHTMMSMTSIQPPCGLLQEQPLCKLHSCFALCMAASGPPSTGWPDH